MPAPTPIPSSSGTRRGVLVTGASSGIGAACARDLARDHALALVARRADRLESLAGAIRADGGTVVTIVADLAEPEAPARVAAEAIARLGRLDVLINNAGVFMGAEGAAITAEHHDQLFALNVRAPMLLAAACLPALRQAGGVVVNISSVAAESAFATYGVYSATKAALERWSVVLRAEERKRGVRVSVVAPGATDTEIWNDSPGIDRGRMCAAADVARAVRLCATAASTACYERITVMPPGGPIE